MTKVCLGVLKSDGELLWWRGLDRCTEEGCSCGVGWRGVCGGGGGGYGPADDVTWLVYDEVVVTYRCSHRHYLSLLIGRRSCMSSIVCPCACLSVCLPVSVCVLSYSVYPYIYLSLSVCLSLY